MGAPRGRLHKAPSTATSVATRRSSRRQRPPQEEEEEAEAGYVSVYQELLSESTSSKAAGPEEDSKPLKKRKTIHPPPQKELSPDPEKQTEVVPVVEADVESQSAQHNWSTRSNISVQDAGKRILQTVEDSDESDDSDQEWEDALDQGDANDDDEDPEDVVPEVGDLSITIGGDKGKDIAPKRKVRRRGITSIDKKLRLDIHMMHVLCLLYHVHRRNAWCNDSRVQAKLRKILPSGALAKFVPMPEYSQYQASKQFLEGLRDLRSWWTNRFSVTALGMQKPRWADVDSEVQSFTDFSDLDEPMELEEFRKAAVALQGSQDIGAQLFCALLRGIGVEARLVCSLQCLPFASAAQVSSPQKTSPNNVLRLDPYNREQSSPTKPKPKPVSSRSKRPSRLERALGERHRSIGLGVAPKQKKKYHTAFPVYWIEVFNSAQQRWVAVDPLSTFTVDKPDKLEPPLNFSQNSLVYTIAFEEDSSARDVTRRYAKAYNAKTRKFRIDCSEVGAKWWRRALKPFRRRTVLDRDQVEEAALARREAGEGIPKNVQDFKNHPIYVLERHLRHNEVIHPMHSVGKVNVGTSMNPKMESIYRRKEVHLVRSADKWYRLGRDVIGGEQPLKHAKPRKGARRSVPPDEGFEDQIQDELGAALYAEFQTELYIPPPVVGGRVPRNVYGNLDLYVPSMVPEGGTHIRHKLAAKAARIVGVDYAEAVTGFNFKGRHGTAVVQGVVVAQEYQDAVEAVIRGMEYAQEEAEEALRTSESLRLWRRFYLGLKIAQRVNAIEIDGETGPTINVQAEIEKQDKAITEQQLAGGFFMDDAEGPAASPPPVRRHYRRVVDEDEDEDEEMMPADMMSRNQSSAYTPNHDMNSGGFISEHQSSSLHTRSPKTARAVPGGESVDNSAGNDMSGGFIPEDDAIPGGFIPEDEAMSGGFIPEDNHMSGGFIPEDDGVSGGFVREPSSHQNITSPLPQSIDEDSNDHDTVNVLESSPKAGENSIKASKGISGEGLNTNSDTEHRLAERIKVIEDEQSSDGSELQKVTVPEVHVREEDTKADITIQDPNHQAVEDGRSKDSAPTHISSPASTPSEAGSLMSEDPDDEDAEPDWLLDAT